MASRHIVSTHNGYVPGLGGIIMEPNLEVMQRAIANFRSKQPTTIRSIEDATKQVIGEVASAFGSNIDLSEITLLRRIQHAGRWCDYKLGSHQRITWRQYSYYGHNPKGWHSV